MKNVGLIAFGTFGSPNGFTQSIFKNNDGLDKELKDFDLDSNAIELLPSTKMYAIRKEKIGRNIGISYALYTYAKEKASDRKGSFIGSAFVFKNGQVADENLTIQVLNNFHQDLISKNLSNQRLKVIHSKELSVSKPKDFDKLEYNLKEIPKINPVFGRKTLLVYISIKPEFLRSHFQTALHLLEKYDTILFTEDREVVVFAQNRGLFSILDEKGFEEEKQKIEEEKKRKIQNLIAEYHNEIRNIDSEQEEKLKIHKDRLEKNKNKHEENRKAIEKLEDNIHKIKEQYESFKRIIHTLIKDLENNKPIEEVKKIFKEKKDVLINNLRQLSDFVSIGGISTEKVSTLPTAPSHRQEFYNFDKEERKEREFKLDKVKLWLFGVCVLLFILLCFSIYYIFSQRKDIENLEKSKQEYINSNAKKEDDNNDYFTTLQLSPEPNSQIDNNSDLFKKLNKDFKIEDDEIDDVVDLIFTKNPKDVQRVYENQKKQYKERLYQGNTSSFKIKDNDTIIVEKLDYIPTYKDDK